MKKASKLKGMIILYLLTVFCFFACASPYEEYHMRGQQNYYKGNYEQAIRDYTDAIMSTSSNHERSTAYSNRCLAYRMKKDWDHRLELR